MPTAAFHITTDMDRCRFGVYRTRPAPRTLEDMTATRLAAARAPATDPGPPGRGARVRGALPGLAVTAAATGAAMVLGAVVPAASPLLTAIVLGVVCAQLMPTTGRLAPGLGVAARPVLRIGVALLGLQLALGDVLGLGAGALVVVVAAVAIGIGATWVLGGWLGVPPVRRFLFACGFSICGAAAVAAAGPTVDAKQEDTAAAVALVVVFGSLMIPLGPLVAAGVGLSDEQTGIFLGAGIHEVAQVVAAGGLAGGGVLAVAVLVKLARVLLLAPVMTGAALVVRRRTGTAAGPRPAPVPGFILGFIACVAIASVGLVPGAAITGAGLVQTAALTAAMFALGTGVHPAALRGIGIRPVLLAAASTLVVGGVALAGAAVLG